MFRLVLFFALCGLALPAWAGEASLPSLALDPPALPASAWNGLDAAGDRFAVSGAAKTGAAALPASTNQKTGAHGAGLDLSGIHVSLHIAGGAMAGGEIRH